MFSVGASPYNSEARQLYGGWSVADAGNNLWAQKQAYQMAAKYSADAEERKAARKWLKMYKVAAQDTAWRARVRSAGKPYWNKAVYPKMTPEQKAAIYAMWLRTPFSENAREQMASRVLRGAPYPGPTITNFNRAIGVPLLPEGAPIPEQADWGKWRSTDDLKAEFLANRSINRSYTAAEVAQAMGISADSAQAYMDALSAKAAARRRVKKEEED